MKTISKKTSIAFSVFVLVLAAASIPLTSYLLGQPQQTESKAAASSTEIFSLNRLSWLGKNWFSLGVNIPWLNWGCDFGCTTSNGVVKNKSLISTEIAKAKTAGATTFRWWVFPGDPWQISRDASGNPAGLNQAIYADFDAALQIAQEQGIYYNFVLFSSPTHLPQSWVTNATNRQKLAEVLGPLFARYKGNPHVLSWEIYNEPEFDIWNGKIDQTSVTESGRLIADSVHRNSTALVTVGSAFADGIPMWIGKGLDYYSPHWYDYMNGGDYCIRCNSFEYYQSKWGVDKPIVVGELYLGNDADPLGKLNDLYSKGFAGAWGWSLFYDHTNDRLQVDLDALKRFRSSKTDIGPLSTGALPTSAPTLSPSPTVTTSPISSPTPTVSPSPLVTLVPPSVGGSTLIVYAAGTSVRDIYPTLRIQVFNGSSWVTVKESVNVMGDPVTRNFIALSYAHPTKLTIDKVRVRFTNDAANKKSGEDRNLVVDKINLDGVDYESESPLTYSDGSWSSDSGCKGGYKQSEWLHCNGYFQYKK